MQVSTFDDDLLGLSEFANRLEKFIEVEHQFVSGSLVLALNSKFGSGKTTFLKMWKSALDRREDKDTRPLVISLNAWESDYYGDPLFAIISSLVESIQQNGESAKSLVGAAKDVGWFATAIGGTSSTSSLALMLLQRVSLLRRKRSLGNKLRSWLWIHSRCTKVARRRWANFDLQLRSLSSHPNQK